MMGVLAPLLQKLGNPRNMGICVVCFEKDIAGALGFHRASVVQYLSPEILGFVLGSLVVSLIYKLYLKETQKNKEPRFSILQGWILLQEIHYIWATFALYLE